MADEQATLTPQLVADLKEQSRILYCITPMEGELMTAGVVGGTLEGVDKLLKAAVRDVGAPVTVLVEKIATDDAGAITFTLLVLRYSRAVMRKKRMASPAPPNDPARHASVGEGAADD